MSQEAAESVVVQKKEKEQLVIVGMEGNGAQPVNLQESFAKFRDQKIKERRIMKMCQQAQLENGRTEEFKQNLRGRFVEQLKRYLGVPYGIKYKDPEAPVAPLYLDCCALVRQAVQDLQEDFGFVIGKWNQAYQIDTLPIVLEKEQLQAGDLIFYEGEYYSNRSKPQKHDIVHVEVYLGPNEECIGSRYHRGTVSLFPSYQFTSTTWRLVKYHFRSLDTWLEGLCISCCPLHPWQSDALNYVEAAGRRSIFADDAQEDVSAGGEEEGEEGESSTLPPPISSEEPALDTSDANTNDKQPEHPTEYLDMKENQQNSSFNKNDSQNIATSTISAESSEKKSKRHSQYANRSVTKSLTSIDNMDKSSQKQTKSTSVRNSNDSQSAVPRTYYVAKANGWKLVKAALDKRGWQQLPFDYQFSSRFGFKWVERRSQIDYRAHVPGQLVCHIPNNDIITTKVGLLTALRDHYNKTSSTVDHSCVPNIPFLPTTYDLEAPADVKALLEQADAMQQEGKGGVWIYKPPCNNRGRGIKVVSGVSALKEICFGDESKEIAPLKGIVQKYIERPLLLEDVGYKFDIRCYMLIARNYPHTLAFYHPGYCRLALKPYVMSNDEDVLNDTMMHLTNASVQKKDPIYKENKDKQIQSIAMIVQDLESRGQSKSVKYITEQMDEDIKKCMAHILTASNSKLLKKHGYFDLLGCDFMLTADNQLYLLEINTNPALSLDNGVLEELLPGVVDGAVELVLATQGPEVSDLGSAALPDPLPGRFQLIFDEGKKYAYGK